LAQFLNVMGCGVRQVALALSPNVLIGVELRGIRRKPVHLESGVTDGKILFHQAPAMNRTAVPQQHDWSVKMTLEVAKKLHNLNARDVLAMKGNYKPNLPRWGETVRAEIVEMRSLR
jgi:hypothetical protein